MSATGDRRLPARFMLPVTGFITVVEVASVWVRGGPTTCIDGRPLQRIARNG